MAIGDFGESKVTVKKGELLAVLKKNREGHRDEFIKAQEGYRAAVVRELEQSLEDARGGRRIRRVIELVEPRDHTKDYDRVIRMLEMSTHEEITISEAQFNQYVMDEWGWSEVTKTANSRYLR